MKWLTLIHLFWASLIQSVFKGRLLELQEFLYVGCLIQRLRSCKSIFFWKKSSALHSIENFRHLKHVTDNPFCFLHGSIKQTLVQTCNTWLGSHHNHMLHGWKHNLRIGPPTSYASYNFSLWYVIHLFIF
jgi:hypothetical protein